MSTQLREITIPKAPGLGHYRDIDGTEDDVQNILSLGGDIAEELGIGRIWMVSGSRYATSEAEIIPSMCRLLGSAGVDCRWLVLETDDEGFLNAARALSDRLYGATTEGSLDEHREAFERVSGEAAQALRSFAEPRDLVLFHGVSTVGIASALDDPAWGRLMWYCHGGSAPEAEPTAEAWQLLEPMLEPYVRCLFSEQRFTPAFLRGKSSVVTPGIDPLNHKNREMRPYELAEVLRAAGLIERPGSRSNGMYERRVKVARGNAWKEEAIPSLLYKPLVVQISRFDRLKGLSHALDAFQHLLKVYPERIPSLRVVDDRVNAEMERLEMVIAGPDPDDLPYDLEGQRVARELAEQHAALPPDVQSRVHILKIPMVNRRENALVVNALQRLAAVTLCNALHQGFGFVVTESLWKKSPVIASKAGGVSLQIRPGTDGQVVQDPTDEEAVALAILKLLGNRLTADSMGRSGHKRVVGNFLVLHQLQALLGEFQTAITASNKRGPREVGSLRPAPEVRRHSA